MIRVFTDRIELNDGTEVESNEYAYLTIENIEELAEKLEDSEVMTQVAVYLGFGKALETDENDWTLVEGDYEDLGREIVERDYSLDWDLEDYFDYEKFGRDYADTHNGIEVDNGILIEE